MATVSKDDDIGGSDTLRNGKVSGLECVWKFLTCGLCLCYLLYDMQQLICLALCVTITGVFVIIRLPWQQT